MAVLSDAQCEAGWTIAKLGDICAFVAGSAFPQKEQGKVSGDYPFAKVKDLQSVAGLSWRNIDNWIEESQLKTLKSKIIPVKSIVFAKIGEGLKRERFAMSSVPMCIDNNLMAAVPSTEVNNIWLYYKFKTLNISSLIAGSALPYLRVQDLKDLDISLPPLEEQERIAGILGSLDDKIEANTRLIQTLSDYCVALVDSLKLFEGSRESTLGEIIEFSPKVKKPVGEEYQFIDMSSLPTMGPVPETISSKSSWSGAKFENGDTLFARITPCLENGKTAIAMGLGNEPACGSTEFIVMRANTPAQVILPYGIARSDKFRQEAMSHMIGSTGRQRVKWQDLANIPASVPSESDMQKIEKSSDIFEYFEALRKENLQLATTRDALIKRLIG